MRWYIVLLDVLRQLLNRPTPPVEQDTIPTQITSTQENAPVLRIHVYASRKLREHRGRWPEKVIADSLKMSVEDAGFNYAISWGFEQAYTPPTEDPYEGDFDSLWWWDENAPDDESHVSLLLTDSKGGVTGPDGHCLAGTTQLSHRSEFEWAGNTPTIRAIHAALHEVGHALGVPGDIDPETDAVETHGESWVDGEKWHRSLVLSTDEATENVCGTAIDPNHEVKRPVVYHQRYSECSIERILEHYDE